MDTEEAIGSTQRSGPYTFKWTKLHLPRSKTDPLRYEYDTIGAKALDQLQVIAKSKGFSDDPRKRPDFYQLLVEHHASHEDLQALWTQVHTVPDWVDWEQLERGQRFFYRYAAANVMGFALQGFVGENSSAPGVVEVLIRTGGFSTRVLLHRLLETFQWVLQATESVAAIRAGGAAHESTVRVRLLHAAVRQRILKLAAARPGYFDVGAHGVPANALDSVHSVATFCCNHMWLQLPRMGVRPTAREAEDYVALFRYLGHLLGAPDDGYFATAARARATMESMLVHELAVTPASRVVCHNFVACLVDLPPFNVSAGFIEAGSRVLNGDALCDELGMGRPGWVPYACFRGHCWLVSALAVAQRLSPAFDEWAIASWKRLFHTAVIQSGLKGASKFDFKYLPREGSKVGKEDNQRQGVRYGFFSRPVEVFYFGIFLFVLTLASTVCLVAAGCMWIALSYLMSGYARVAVPVV
ncbi:putative transcriptional regulator [Rosellinia necatrix]|uniref:Putative transcriptional regulator n=1 Tax=Rosellinia necatrix TaxID=77044 RepID=A0A1S7UP19_ROSNE|nr:putative transcriptional regulator [Rosellinia necatrix]